MIVRAVWEFEVDTSDLDPKYIDIPGLAKDLTANELKSMIDNNSLSSEDFEYSVVIE